ncbi:MAG: efflux RND transporter permease subunit [Vicinamibacterales bacterium]
MLSELCVRRPVFATMLVMSLVVLGIFSFRDLGVDLFPKADPASVNVSLRLPGAAPDEMTSAVIMPMENALSGIAGIDQMSSTVSAGGVGSINIRFLLDRDLEDAANSVREKVAGAMRQVPPEVLPPIIQKQDPDADPIMTVMLSSKTTSLRTLTEIADKLVKRSLEAVDGVGAVTMSGDRPREIHVVVDVEKLNARGLSVDQVRDAIQKENVETPGGSLEQGKWEVDLRTLGRVDAARQFNDIIVATVNGTPVRISDVGYVEDTVARVLTSLFNVDGSPAVQLDIRRASGENTIRVIEAINQKLAPVRQQLPRGVNLTVTSDDSRFIYASIASLEEHLLWGSLLASLVVMFFIRNVRAVLISALAIPASIIATFTLMRGMDFTLNNMTLLALTLAVGIVIDDAIVVLENIFRYIEEEHQSPFDAAITGTREVALPVMATTLSLIVIFLPVAFMTGYARRFIYPFGWTMAFSILVSMLVSFTLTPMLSSRFLEPHRRRTGSARRASTASSTWVEGVYARVSAVDARAPMVGHRCLTPGLLAHLPAEPHRRQDVRAQRRHGRVHGSRRHTAGNLARGDDRDRASDRRRDREDQEGVASIYVPRWAPIATTTSTSSSTCCRRTSEPSRPGPGDRPGSTRPGQAPRRESDRAGAESVRVAEVRGGSSIQANLRGPDLDTLYDYSQQLLAKAKLTPSLVDARTDYSNASPEVQVAVDRSRAADLGVRMADRRQHAAADGGGRRRDLVVSRGGRAVSGEDPRAREPAARHRYHRQADGRIDQRTAGSDRQHRQAESRLRTDTHHAQQPPVLNQLQRRHRAGARARRSRRTTSGSSSRTAHAARLRRQHAGADAQPGRDDRQPDDGDRCSRASSSTWCSRHSSRASCSRSSSWRCCRCRSPSRSSPSGSPVAR